MTQSNFALVRTTTDPSSLRRSLPFLIAASVVTLCLLASPNDTQAKGSTSDKNATVGTPAKKKGVSKITYQRSSSEESRAERDRRMYRECKGMHNAGACRGYTRK